MSITLPHQFQDGVGEPASGVQVDENFNVLKAAVEALELAHAGLAAKALLIPTGKWTPLEARSGATNYIPSASRPALVNLHMLSSGTPWAYTVTVGGVTFGGEGETNTAGQATTDVFFMTAPGEAWSFASSNVVEARSTHRLL